jgi:homogentisate 1,2-dioxygenase
VDRTEELAVMLDAFRPLRLSAGALGVSDPEYPFSWSRTS